MENILKETNTKIRESIRKGIDNTLVSHKPFAIGMYRFAMFIIRYYVRVRETVKIDYDSFIILQVVVSHSLYLLNKKKSGGKSYSELEIEWEKLINKNDISQIVENYSNTKNNLKLTISSICLVTSLPKETVRRKVNELNKRNLLKISKKEGVILGTVYKKVFREFVPQTTLELSKLIKNWENTGVLKSILSFKT
jgi:Glu-tRNA(Gln) amidotransferase subunit E-like FAD-binding protein